ncbi:MAG: hypothetical protein M0R33_22365 [Methylomonas sp.]|jgi:hypothetical protein|uniref:hypothetical protein n=1 Tax=Methylomonas sp. TaxID=418 RepID=UPI00260050C9|nr:hypothetical protein [Methylomonas sp.]MCK9609189.1 hypothetical protein [Methylomonas sp.]
MAKFVSIHAQIIGDQFIARRCADEPLPAFNQYEEEMILLVLYLDSFLRQVAKSGQLLQLAWECMDCSQSRKRLALVRMMVTEEVNPARQSIDTFDGATAEPRKDNFRYRDFAKHVRSAFLRGIVEILILADISENCALQLCATDSSVCRAIAANCLL